MVIYLGVIMVMFFLYWFLEGFYMDMVMVNLNIVMFGYMLGRRLLNESV